MPLKSRPCLALAHSRHSLPCPCGSFLCPSPAHPVKSSAFDTLPLHGGSYVRCSIPLRVRSVVICAVPLPVIAALNDSFAGQIATRQFCTVHILRACCLRIAIARPFCSLIALALQIPSERFRSIARLFCSLHILGVSLRVLSHPLPGLFLPRNSTAPLITSAPLRNINALCNSFAHGSFSTPRLSVAYSESVMSSHENLPMPELCH